MDKRKYFIQASETYLDLLEKTDLSVEDIDEEYICFTEKIDNQEFIEEKMTCKEIIDSCEFLHNEKINKEIFNAGLIIVLDTSKRKIILDGNHRLNLMKEENLDFVFDVIIIDGNI